MLYCLLVLTCSELHVCGSIYSSAAVCEDAQESQVEKENCFGILKSAAYELHSFILKLTANENIGPVPGQATCRPWESAGESTARTFRFLASFQPTGWTIEELARGTSRKSASFYLVDRVP